LVIAEHREKNNKGLKFVFILLYNYYCVLNISNTNIQKGQQNLIKLHFND